MTPMLHAWRERGKSDSPARTVTLVRVLLAFEASLYSVITPILPHYAAELGAAKPALGILVACYPAGFLVGGILGAQLVARAGVRRTTLVGLLLFALALAPFGFGATLPTLDGLRLAQGMASGCIWGGALAWVIAITPRAVRGITLGSVMSSVVLGTMAGPVLGTVVLAAGPRLVFALLGCMSLSLMWWTARHPEPAGANVSLSVGSGALLRSRRVLFGCWIVLVVALAFGAITVLIPVRLSSFGGSGAVIGLVFAVGSLCGAWVAATVGRMVDRRGVTQPLIGGLAASTTLLVLLPMPGTVLVLAILTVATIGGPLICQLMPAMSLITDGVEQLSAASGVSAMLFNISSATGELVGSPTAAALAHATSDSVALGLLAALMLLTLGFVSLARARQAIPRELLRPPDRPIPQAPEPDRAAEGPGARPP